MAAHGVARPEADEEDEQEPEYFEVWPENWEIVMAFCKARRCWDIDSMTGRYLRLNRPQVESTMRMMQISPERQFDVLEGLMVMEDAALPVINRQIEQA